jgi:Transposase, Mutator family
LALAVGTGLQVLQVMLAEDVAWLVGPKGRHLPGRTAVRHGSEPGQVTLGGRRVRVQRPRVRTADGTGELPVPSYQAFAATDLLDGMAVERMLAKLSTRRYQVGLEPVGSGVEQASSGTSRSAVSRRFVARTEHALAELLAADLSALDLVALLVDGIRVADHCCVVALGITIDGTKIPLALAEGATENATVTRDLLTGLRERGLDVTRPILVVIDGARRCAAPSATCSTTRSSNAASSTSSATSPTGSPTRWPPPSPGGCGPPTATPTRWSPRPTWKPSRGSWTAPTRAPRPASARAGRDPDDRPARRAAHARPDPQVDEFDRVDDRDLP